VRHLLLRLAAGAAHRLAGLQELHQPVPPEEPSEPAVRDAAAAAPVRGPAAAAAAAAAPGRPAAVMMTRPKSTIPTD